MRGYKQLDYLKRCQIYDLWQAGHNRTQIAKEVRVHKSAITKYSPPIWMAYNLVTHLELSNP